MGEAEVEGFPGAFPAEGLISDHRTDQKSNSEGDDHLLHGYENPALVLDQLLPIDMSSPTLLINETPPARNRSSALVEFDQSDDLNPFHTSHIAEPPFPGLDELELLQLSTPVFEHPPQNDDTLVVSGSETPNPARSLSVDSPKYIEDSFGNRVLVDTAAPFESVKEAVSKFGGIVDWKAHKVQTVERQRFIEQELEKAQEDVPMYRKLYDQAEEEKARVLRELDETKRVAEELKVNLERVQTEENQARQDVELVKLGVEEMEQGIAEESSVAAKAQVEVAKARQAAAISDLQSAKEELESLKKDCAAMVVERDLAVKKVEKAAAEAKEVEKTVQGLTIELIAEKESLESAHAAHLEAEERRVATAAEKERSLEKWETELKELEIEVGLLDREVLTAKDLQAKLDAALVLLTDLNTELANYMESKMGHGAADEGKTLRRTHTGIQASVASAEKELEDVRQNIEKTVEEVELLKLVSSALRAELESENEEVAELRDRENRAKQSVRRLEEEVNGVELELAAVKGREMEVKEKMMGLPEKVPEAEREAERVKSEAAQLKAEMERVKEEAERVKGEAIMVESRVAAAEKEAEAAKASENLAIGAVKALNHSQSQNGRTTDDDEDGSVTVSLEEYYELGKRAHEAEERANSKLQEAEARVESAKQSQLRSLEKLEQVDQEAAERKEVLNTAVKRAEAAAEGKLMAEDELRKLRASGNSPAPTADSCSASDPCSNNQKPIRHESSNYIRLPTAHYTPPPPAGTVAEGDKAGKKKKRSFFPRILMFMARRKAHSSK